MLQKFSYAIAITLIIVFPFYLWLLGWSQPIPTAIYLFLIGILRLVSKSIRHFEMMDWVVAITPIGVALMVLLNGPRAGLYYPIVVNAGFLAVFYSSLSGSKSSIQKLAEKVEGKELDIEGARYTRIVTKVWCGFFVFNIFVSAILEWCGLLNFWTLYNGFISYILIVVLFVGERLIRPRFQKSDF